MKRAQCNPEKRSCSSQRKRRRVCFTKPNIAHIYEKTKPKIANIYEKTKPKIAHIDFTSPKLAHIDEKGRKQDGLDSIQAQISPYTVDLTRPKLVRIVARPSSPFVIDLTN